MQIIGDLPVIVGRCSTVGGAAAAAAVVGLFAKRRPIFTVGNFEVLNKPVKEKKMNYKWILMSNYLN